MADWCRFNGFQLSEALEFSTLESLPVPAKLAK
jgi:hypothetical protein